MARFPRTDFNKRSHPDELDGALNLRDQMPAAASFGHFCRTQGFVNMTHENWMEGVQIAPGQWVLKMATCRLDQSQSAESPKRTTVEITPIDGVHTLIDVLERLYEFEAGYSEHQDSAIVFKTAEELGTNHYIAFGRREGIGFDTDGKPLITVNGHIMEMAQLDYKEIEATREAWAEKEKKFLPTEDELLPSFPLSIETSQLDGMLAAMDCNAFALEFQDRLNASFKAFENLVVGKSAPDNDLRLCLHANQSLSNFIDRKLAGDDADKTSSSVNEVRGKLQQYVLILDLHVHLYAAKKMFGEHYKNGGSSEMIRSEIMENAQEIRDRYIALGSAQPISIQQILADIIRLNKPYGHVIETYPAAFRSLKKTAEEMCERSEKIKDDMRRSMLTPPKKDNDPPPKSGHKKPLGSQIADMMGPGWHRHLK